MSHVLHGIVVCLWLTTRTGRFSFHQECNKCDLIVNSSYWAACGGCRIPLCVSGCGSSNFKNTHTIYIFFLLNGCGNWSLSLEIVVVLFMSFFGVWRRIYEYPAWRSLPPITFTRHPKPHIPGILFPLDYQPATLRLQQLFLLFRFFFIANNAGWPPRRLPPFYCCVLLPFSSTAGDFFLFMWVQSGPTSQTRRVFDSKTLLFINFCPKIEKRDRRQELFLLG